MSLSQKLKDRISVAITNKDDANELIAAIEASVASPAAAVAAMGSTTNLPASNATLSTSDTYADADVKVSIDGAVDALRTATESRLDAIEAKIDAVIASLKASGQMES